MVESGSGGVDFKVLEYIIASSTSSNPVAMGSQEFIAEKIRKMNPKSIDFLKSEEFIASQTYLFKDKQ
jgi:hypothetical protein